ncbi:MAG: hypothetical protein H0T56_07555 [Pseudaminobacter sp.]|nr:hypothetical protein [Pseudaminobacter sp.]
MTIGVLYIAFGKKYIDEAVFSARSLKSVSPKLSITLFTDQACSADIFDAVRLIDVQHKRAKVDYMTDSPYERTLYLDSDTEVRMDLTEAFEILDRFDIAAAHSLGRKSPGWARSVPEYNDICYAFPEYNSGVVFYRRSSACDRLFALWREKFYAYQNESNGRDQLSFRIALWLCDCRIHTLGQEYNVRSAAHRERVEKLRLKDGLTTLQPRILHWHGLHDKPLVRLASKHRPYKY